LFTGVGSEVRGKKGIFEGGFSRHKVLYKGGTAEDGFILLTSFSNRKRWGTRPDPIPHL